MSPEVQAMELLNHKLEGTQYPKLRADITQFLFRAQRELTPEDHETFRETLSRALTQEVHAFHAAMSFGELFGNNTGLKVDFNKFVGDKFKLSLDSNARTQEVAALGAYNVGVEPEEQSPPGDIPSVSTETCTESSSSLSGNESEAAPTTFAGVVPEQSAEQVDCVTSNISEQ